MIFIGASGKFEMISYDYYSKYFHATVIATITMYSSKSKQEINIFYNLQAVANNMVNGVE